VTKACYIGSAASLIGLIFLCLAWELWGAPLHAGGSWLVLKAVPLLAPLRGVLAGRRYTYQWALMLILAYFMEGTMRAYAEAAPATWYALAETALSIVFFASATLYVRRTGPATTTA
jgi:Predicted membrane protein